MIPSQNRNCWKHGWEFTANNSVDRYPVPPSVSIIIPTWNRASTIEAAVRSATNQTLKPLEILVCDDGSDDATESIVNALRSEDASVRWLPGTRAGRPAVPRNRGICESRGDWIAFLDSDDQWHRDKLEKQLTLAQRLNCLAVCSNALRMVSSSRSDGYVLAWPKEMIRLEDLLRVNQVVCSSAVVHRSIITATEGFPEDTKLKALEDYALWLRVATRTDFAYVNEPLVMYRDEPVASVRAESTSLLRQRAIVFGNFLRWVFRSNALKLPWAVGAIMLAGSRELMAAMMRKISLPRSNGA
jgi:teichuronic acid biosynthesis glycosyltransferase TuaG